MIGLTSVRRAGRWTSVGTVILSAACATAVRPGGEVASRAARVSDVVIARDLARLDSLAGPSVAPAGELPSRWYLRERTRAMAGLARDAYQRNDDGALTDLLLRQGEVAAVPRLSRTRRTDLWTLLDSATAVPALVAARGAELIALEVALLRAQHDVLGAPRCDAWEGEAVRIAALVRTPLLVARAPAPAPAVPPAAAPTPVPTPVAPVAPVMRELRGVPSRVHFALDRSDLAPATKRVLDMVVDSLRAYPDVRLVLEGNTDQRGSVEYNAALSRRRAVSVMEYLRTKGLDPARVEIRALGKTQLETTVEAAGEFARNRRVQLRYFLPSGRELPVTNQVSDLQVERRRP